MPFPGLWGRFGKNSDGQKTTLFHIEIYTSFII
jgi:hypothetical protein